jgi:putative hydroxymethylpyrimidine transport system permease protein
VNEVTPVPTAVGSDVRRRRRKRHWLPTYGPAALVLLALAGAWELATRVGGIPNYLLPSLDQVFTALWQDRSVLGAATRVTVTEMLLGFLIAAAAALLLATLLHMSATLRRAVYPLLIGSQTIPVVVLAPILAIAFGYNIAPKLAIVGLVCFFPLVVNTLDGLRSVDPQLIKLMRTLDSSRWGTFCRVEFPSALPSVFSGARIAATFAAIGAVFGEWSGSTKGLGYVMLQATPQLQTSLVFAAIFVLTAMSVAIFLLVSVAERLLAPWIHRERSSNK